MSIIPRRPATPPLDASPCGLIPIISKTDKWPSSEEHLKERTSGSRTDATRVTGATKRNMKGLVTVAVHTLLLFLVSSFIVQSRNVPQGYFQRRNWTPQAMLYLKGAQGRRFIAGERKHSDVFEKIDIETRSQNTNPLTLSKAMAILLASLRQAQEGEDEETQP